MPWERRDEPWRYVPLDPEPSQTAAPDRVGLRYMGSGRTPRRANAGPVRRGAFEKDYKPARHSQAEEGAPQARPQAWAAAWRGGFLPRVRTGANRGRLGTGGS
jgi:hypothetical protein